MKANMTLREFGEKVGWKPAYICDIELGRKRTSLHVIEVYAKAFGLKTWRLMKQIESGSKPEEDK